MDPNVWPLHLCLGRAIGRFLISPGKDYGIEAYPDFDLWIGVSGSTAVGILGRSVTLTSDRMLLIPPRVPVHVRTDGPRPFEMVFAHFDLAPEGRRIEDAQSYCDPTTLTLTLPGVPALALVAPIDGIALSDMLLLAASRLDDDLVQLEMTGQLWQLIWRLRRAYVQPQGAGTPGSTPLDHALNYMRERLNERLTLTAIAKHTGVSVPTLMRLFKRNLRVTPSRHLTRLRMARARDLMRSGDLNISEIAHACGYQSLAFFSRTFKAEHGQSPRGFRRQLTRLP